MGESEQKKVSARLTYGKQPRASQLRERAQRNISLHTALRPAKLTGPLHSPRVLYAQTTHDDIPKPDGRRPQLSCWPQPIWGYSVCTALSRGKRSEQPTLQATRAEAVCVEGKKKKMF